MKRGIFSYLILSTVFLILTGCQEPKDDDDPVNPVVHTYSAYAVRSEVLVGETDSLWYSSNADSVIITTMLGTFLLEDPAEGFFLLYIAEEGSFEVNFKFFWNDSLSPFTSNKQCTITSYQPLQVTFPTDPIPWRTGATFHLETHFADSTVISYSGIDTVITGNYPRYFTTNPLDSNTVIRVVTYNKLGKVEASETIYVKDPTREDTLSYKMGPWKMVKLEFKYLDGPWHEEAVSLCLSDDLVYYYLYPEKTGLYDIGEIPCFEGESNRTGFWYLENEDTVLVTYQYVNQTGYSYQVIKFLDENTLVLIDNYQNGQSTKTTYNHP